MLFKITKSNNKKTLEIADSWLDLLKSLSNDVVKVEKLDDYEANSEENRKLPIRVREK